MSIRVLTNPKTVSYCSLKEEILSVYFSWYWIPHTTSELPYDTTKYANVPQYAHNILSAAEKMEIRIPIIYSEYAKKTALVLLEILQFNNIHVRSFFRININCVHPQQNVVSTVPHTDHNFMHNNMLVYLTDAGGKTFVEEEYHDPNEDDVIMFDGSANHYLQTPKDKRRIVIVATFI